MQKVLRVGTRKSLLATTQTQWAVDQILALQPDLQAQTHYLTTQGDRDQSTALSKIGGVGLFTKELDNALLEDRIDIGVHSLKDLPTDIHKDLVIAVTPERVDPRDAMISTKAASLATLPPGATVGTSSLRRAAQLAALRGDVKVVDLRGNLDTRMNKAQSGALDAIIVACAGLIRLGREKEITERIEPKHMLPAVGQGALAVVTRKADGATRAAIEGLDHAPTRAAVTVERRLLATLGGGCQIPIGAHAQIVGERSVLHAVVASTDGALVIRKSLEGTAAGLDELADQMAQMLRADGADDILKAYN